MTNAPFPVLIYVRILGSIEFFGLHDVWAVPRVGETILLSRHDEDHTLTVIGVEHKIGVGHSISVTCK